MIHSGNLVLSNKQAISNKILMNNTLHYSQNTAPHQECDQIIQHYWQWYQKSPIMDMKFQIKGWLIICMLLLLKHNHFTFRKQSSITARKKVFPACRKASISKTVDHKSQCIMLFFLFHSYLIFPLNFGVSHTSYRFFLSQ